MQKGILIFAKNNEKVNYIKQAKVCATLAKHFLPNTPVCLITDSNISDPIFDIVKIDPRFKQQKKRYNTTTSNEELSYFNIGKTNAFELSPFNETLLLDTDYFIQNNTLNLVWNSTYSLLMNKNYNSIYKPKEESFEPYIGKWGPFMYWATVIYFKKDAQAKIIFDVARHVEENYDFYRGSYNLSGKILRNDYVFSIAIELCGSAIHALPVSNILNSYEFDEILNVKKEAITFICNRNHIGKIIPIQVSKQNVHIMNKLDLNNHLDSFLKVYNV